MVNFGVGERIFVAVASLAEFGDGGTAWIGKTENFGDFIKTFADGIVFGGADDFKIGVGGHADELGVAARNKEGENGEGGAGGLVGSGEEEMVGRGRVGDGGRVRVRIGGGGLKRISGGFWGGEESRVNMGLEMMNWVKGFVVQNSESAGSESANKERTE